MPVDKVETALNAFLNTLVEEGRAKGKEKVITGVKRPSGEKGFRYTLEGQGDKEFLRMNSNSYLGLSVHPEVIKAEEEAAAEFGAGPGAVRFIDGTFKQHKELEAKIAQFHSKEACMILSSAYLASLGVITQLISKETFVISDELNHNCIINAIRLARPPGKAIYKHNKFDELDKLLADNVGKYKRAVVITDGIFSMRGDHSDLAGFEKVCTKYHASYEEGVITIIDDSHGVGAIGRTGRGTEEYTGGKVDVVVGTLGKAIGVNGGYIATSAKIVEYLRESVPFYIYSNPITPAEAAACLKGFEILDSEEGIKMMAHLSRLTKKFDEGVRALGFETIPGDHPVVPLMIRDTGKTKKLVKHFFDHGILVTGLTYPVVPKGDEEIRTQIAANHNDFDIEYALDVLKQYREE